MQAFIEKFRLWLNITLSDNRRLRNLVIQVATTVLGVSIAFGAYYYWDRYVSLGDQSPIEINISDLEVAVREDPQDPERRIALAESYLGQGRFEDALEQANQVIESVPDMDRAYLMAGIASVRLGDFESAIEPLEIFVDLRDDADTAGFDLILETGYYFLGESYLSTSQPEQAIEVLEKAILIERTDADALYQLGRAYISIQKPEEALNYLHRAVRLVPDFTEVYTAMIDAYAAMDDADYVVYARGMQAFSLGDYDTALVHLQASAEALGDFAPAHVGLGLAFEKLNLYPEALSAIEYALELDPTDLVAQQAFGRLQATLEEQS